MKHFSLTSTLSSITIKIILVIMFTLNLSATSFSGFAGIAGNLTNTPSEHTEDKEVRFSMDTFLTGQLEFSNFLITRGEISFRPANVLKTGLLSYTDTYFRINELSTTIRVNTDFFTHYLALFMGRYESIGSDLFMQRHFGIKPFNSRLTENWRGTAEPCIYPFEKYGLSYVVQPSTNIASGLYFYSYDENDSRVINLDLRFAISSYIVKTDFSFGLGVPLGDGNIGGTEEAVFAIQSIDLHYGLTALFTLGERTDLFFQNGITKISFSGKGKKPTLEDDDLSFLIEPRWLIADASKFSITLYQLSLTNIESSFFLYGKMGIDFIYSNSGIIFGNTDVESGAHLNIALQNQNLPYLDSFSVSEDESNREHRRTEYSFSPFMNISIGKGTIKTAISFDVSTVYSGTPDLYTSLLIGYKTAF